MLNSNFFLKSAIFLSISSSLLASGYSVSEYLNASSLAKARAGGSAIASDASTVFSNPAGMTNLSKEEFLFSAKFLAPTLKFNDKNSIDIFGNPLNGNSGGDGGVLALIPSIFYSKNIEDNLWLGLSLNAPFGLSSEYNYDWVGRYTSINATLKTIDLNPNIAYKVNENFSIGAGISLQYIQGFLASALDFGAICLGVLGSDTCTNLSMPTPQSLDGRVDIEADDISLGFNIGLLYKFNEDTRVGFSYRSKVKHNLKGDSDFYIPQQALAFNPLFADTKAHIKITIPEQYSLSAFHKINEQFAIMGDISLTKWDIHKELKVTYDNLVQPNTIIPKNWEDALRVAGGISYKYNRDLTLEAGIAIDENAIPNSTFDPSVPASKQIWTTLGATYDYSKDFSISLGYAHVFFEDERVNLNGAFGENLNGEMEVDMNVLALDLKYKF